MIIYKYAVDWQIYKMGNLIENKSLAFQTKDEAERFSNKIKSETPLNKVIIINIRKLQGNQIIKRIQKDEGKINGRNV